MCDNCLYESMSRYVGQTVTIYTTSGGLSGSGFTGVLVAVDCNCVRLLCDMGSAPSCPIGSSCSGYYGLNGNYGGCGSYGWGNSGNRYTSNVSGSFNGYYGKPLGAITEIPMCSIACFTHNAI